MSKSLIYDANIILTKVEYNPLEFPFLFTWECQVLYKKMELPNRLENEREVEITSADSFLEEMCWMKPHSSLL